LRRAPDQPAISVTVISATVFDNPALLWVKPKSLRHQTARGLLSLGAADADDVARGAIGRRYSREGMATNVESMPRLCLSPIRFKYPPAIGKRVSGFDPRRSSLDWRKEQPTPAASSLGFQRLKNRGLLRTSERCICPRNVLGSSCSAP
jgi:hypothetical protein